MATTITDNPNVIGGKLISRRMDTLLAKYADTKKLEIHKEVAEGLLVRLRRLTPVRKSPKPVKRYKRSTKRKTRTKGINGKRLRGVKGIVYATYAQGNLRRSFTLGEFSNGNVFIGAGREKSVPAQGDFKGDKADGYYVHMVERGTKYQRGQKFVLKAFTSMGIRIAREAIDLYKKVMDDYLKNNRD